jgi:cell division septation protein DedD
MRNDQQGISNRETPQEEQQERREFPPETPDAPPRERDAAGRVGEEPLDDTRDRHTSHKAGSRSIAQKEADSKYADRSHPASHKVPGAFGEEPAD